MRIRVCEKFELMNIAEHRLVEHEDVKVSYSLIALRFKALSWSCPSRVDAFSLLSFRLLGEVRPREWKCVKLIIVVGFAVVFIALPSAEWSDCCTHTCVCVVVAEVKCVNSAAVASVATAAAVHEQEA